MKHIQTIKEHLNSLSNEKEINEKLNAGWIKGQLIDDAGGLTAGSQVIVQKEQMDNSAPNQDVEIYTTETGHVNIPKSFVELLEKLINEGKKITKPAGGFKKSKVEKLLKQYKDIELHVNNKTYFITAYMHNNGVMSDADEKTLFVKDSKNKEHEIEFKNIDYIEQ